VRSRVGGRWPAHTTGVGLVLLAHAPPPIQEDYLGTPLAGFTELTITDPAALRRVLAEVRRTGYAVSDRQVTMDAVSVAAPVRNVGGAVVAALSVVVGTDGPPPSALVPAVVTAALLKDAWNLEGDRGLRASLRHLPTEAIHLVQAPELRFDLDTPADVEKAIIDGLLDPPLDA